jgi:hypothetical protein
MFSYCQRSGGIYYLHLQVKIWSQLVPPKSLVVTCQTTLYHSPEDHNMILHHCQNLKKVMNRWYIFQITVFCNVTQCSLVTHHQHFGRTCCRRGSLKYVWWSTKVHGVTSQKYSPLWYQITDIHSDYNLLSGFPFICHGNPDDNLESPCTFAAIRASCLVL